MNTQKQQQIERQIDAIEKNFGKLKVERLKFWMIARRAECRMRRANERYLSYEDYDIKNVQKVQDSVFSSVARCFVDSAKIEKALFVNTDPRGYALKLIFEGVKKSGLFTDLGGDGILAPEF